ncbi:hypothetical protein [Dongia sp.]|uniref:hypothetical protein n=1 Tax=Dongia sp. TaxID=1977262 RepID=UPI0035B48A07
MSELEPPVPRKERRARKRPLPLPEVKFVPAGNPSLPTFVSLMLMITTFMIVLTSISLHENTRMHELLSGVKQTFALSGAGSATEKTEGEILGAAAKGFRTALPMAEVETESGGNSLRLALPVSVALDTTTQAATTQMEEGFAALAAALDRLPAETGYEIELRFADAVLAAGFAGILGQAAMNRGIDPKRLFIGNGPGDQDQLNLFVKLAPPPADFVQPLSQPVEAQ